MAKEKGRRPWMEISPLANFRSQMNDKYTIIVIIPFFPISTTLHSTSKGHGTISILRRPSEINTDRLVITAYSVWCK